jgi:hypothetical protein
MELSAKKASAPPIGALNDQPIKEKINTFVCIFEYLPKWHGNSLSKGQTARKIAVKELRRRRI